MDIFTYVIYRQMKEPGIQKYNGAVSIGEVRPACNIFTDLSVDAVAAFHQATSALNAC